jgi:hypothetical protein
MVLLMKLLPRDNLWPIKIYFVMFLGPRRRHASSGRKGDAKAFDVYERDARTVREIRIEREAFIRGMKWANNRSH